jgi:uncharacterized SAM-binding protein YcdF (DUF218 family)
MIYLFLKNFLGKLISPTPLLSLLLILGIFFIKKKQKLQKYHYIFLCLCFFIIGCNPLIDFSLDKYENIHPKYEQTSQNLSIKYIVVLGGGIDPTSTQPLSSQLSVASSIRLIEGIRIHNVYQDSKLVLTGKGGYEQLTEAAAMAQMAIALGVNKDSIIQDPVSKNTFEHTQNLKEILKSEEFILVTSAMHMNRSMLIFRKQGLNPIPAPTQYILKGKYNGFMSNPNLLPTGDNFQDLDQLSYELLSLIYAKIKGYF